MTLTAPTSSSSATLERAVFGDVPAETDTIVTTTDHRRIGRYQVGLSLLSLLGIGALGIVVHGSLGTWWNLSGDLVPRWFSAHQNAMVGFGILPLFAGLATLIVPDQIGARTLAFPRLAALAFWSYAVAVVTFVIGYLVKEGPPTFSSTDPSLAWSKNRATDLVLSSMILVTLSALMSAVNIIATVVTQRRAGLSADAVRPFTWAAFVAAAVTVISAPVGLAGYALAYVDQHFGATLSLSAGFSQAAAHSSFFLGRPEALLPMLLAFGMAADVIVARTGRPLLGGPVANWLLAAAGALSFGVWAVGPRILTSPVAPFGSVAPVFAAAPIGLLVLVLLASILNAGGLKIEAGSVLGSIGVVFAAVLAAVLALAAGWRGVNANAEASGAFAIGFSLVFVFIGPLLGVAAGLAEHGALISGRRLSQGITALAVLALLGATLLSAALTLPGLGDGGGLDGAHQAAAVSKVLLLGGLGLLALGLITAAASGGLNAHTEAEGVSTDHLTEGSN